MPGIDAATLDGATRRSVGEIWLNKTADVVDGHLALVVQSGDTVLTSGAKDIKGSSLHAELVRR